MKHIREAVAYIGSGEEFFSTEEEARESFAVSLLYHKFGVLVDCDVKALYLALKEFYG